MTSPRAPPPPSSAPPASSVLESKPRPRHRARHSPPVNRAVAVRPRPPAAFHNYLTPPLRTLLRLQPTAPRNPAPELPARDPFRRLCACRALVSAASAVSRDLAAGRMRMTRAHRRLRAGAAGQPPALALGLCATARALLVLTFPADGLACQRIL